jgi:hypothetical protein
VQARNPRSPPSALRPVFVVVNLAVYTVQVALWIYLGVTEERHRVNTAQVVMVRGLPPPLPPCVPALPHCIGAT